MRRPVLVALAIIAAAVLSLFFYEYLQIGRQTPVLHPDVERADLIRIEKGARIMTLMRDDRVLKSYRIALGGNPVGDKQMEGDRKTPEGRYSVEFKNAKSAFHLSLRISYPDETDRAEAERMGVKPGGDIMIHGLPNGFGVAGEKHLLRDWTDGCVAVTNDEIEEIWQMADIGTLVDIRP